MLLWSAIEWGEPMTVELIDPNVFKCALDRVASIYDQSAVLERSIGDSLLERLDMIAMRPCRILDLGARTGYTMQHLKQRYPDAQIYGVECSPTLLSMALRRFEKENNTHSMIMVAGDYTAIPLVHHTFDLIFSNLSLHWSTDIKHTLQECYRLLKPGGILLFTTVGPDTLQELRACFPDGHSHIHPFFDMHDWGDLLQQLSFDAPVMDREPLTVQYAHVACLLQDLKGTGSCNALIHRSSALMGKYRWQSMLNQYEKLRHAQHHTLPATIELIYGHAFAPIQRRGDTVSDLEEICVSIEQGVPYHQPPLNRDN